MDSCKNQQSWISYWSENMGGLGYSIPDGLLSNQQLVIGSITTILGAIKEFGPRVTVVELIRAGLLTERLAFVGTGYASFFAGAAIGSAAVASGRYLACGASLADVLEYAASKRLLTPDARQVLTQNPQIFQRRHPARIGYATMARFAR